MNSTSCNDQDFGPVVKNCRNDFDFTLLFEDTVLSLTPSICSLIVAILRSAYLRKRAKVLEAREFQLYKLVHHIMTCSRTKLTIPDCPVALFTNSVDFDRAVCDQFSISKCSISCCSSLCYSQCCISLLTVLPRTWAKHQSVLCVTELLITLDIIGYHSLQNNVARGARFLLDSSLHYICSTEVNFVDSRIN